MAECGAAGEETPLHPHPLEVGMSASQLIDRAFLGATAGQVAHAARLLSDHARRHPDSLIGLSIDATLTSSGASVCSLVPLLEGGYVDWIATTGANLYYDALYALGVPFVSAPGSAADSYDECPGGVWVRRSDRQDGETQLREILSAPDFQGPLSSAQLHHHIGAHLRARAKTLGIEHPALLTAAHDLGVPVFNASMTDSPLGTLIAGLALDGNRLTIDASVDLNQAAAILNQGLTSDGWRTAWCIGRGAAASFLLGLPAHLGMILGLPQAPSYALRIRMAGRAHTLPAEVAESTRPELEIRARGDSAGECGGTDGGPIDLAVSTDLSVALPLLTVYLLDRVPPRPLKRLGVRLDDLLDRLRQSRMQAALRRPAENRGRA